MRLDLLVLSRPRKIPRVVGLLLVLAVAAAVCLPGLLSRAISYDEAITLLEVAGKASPGWRAVWEPAGWGDDRAVPGWPESPRPAGELKPRLSGNPSLSEIAEELRGTDVHPPFYYWALSGWRQLFGPSIEVARALSLLCSVAAVGLLYCFCFVGGIRYPVLPSLTFALTAASIDQAQQARSNAMALLLVMGAALLALAIWRYEPKSGKQRSLGVAALAFIGSAAFLTNYLAAIPIGLIIVWLALVVPRGRAALLAVVAVVGIVTVGPWLPSLAFQLDSRPGQFDGFPGFTIGFISQLAAYAHNLLRPARFADVGSPGHIVGIVAAACLCAVALLRTKNAERPQFLALVWALALAPAAGAMALSFLFDKQIVEERYFVFAVPALAVLITYKVGSFRQPLQALAWGALAALWVSQLLAVNWGYETTHGRRAAKYRSLSQSVEAAGVESSVLFAGVEYGDGIPAALVYELPEALPVVFLQADSDPMEAAAMLDHYEYVWQVPAGGPTSAVERAVADRLLQLGRAGEPAPDATLFRRR